MFSTQARGAAATGALPRPEGHRRAVHAIPLAGRLGPVVEHMAKVSAAARAMHLHARHHHPAIGLGAHRLGQGCPEARPAGAALELGLAAEQRVRASRAGEGARTVLGVERARSRPLGRLVAQHAIGRGRQLGLPLGVAELDRKALRRGSGRRAAAERGPQRGEPGKREEGSAIGHGPRDRRSPPMFQCRRLGTAPTPW